MSRTREEEAHSIIACVDSNLYKVLGVGTDADDAVIKLAYRKLALRFHPDKNKSSVTPSAERAFKAINLAFQILSDAISRDMMPSVPQVTSRMGAPLAAQML